MVDLRLIHSIRPEPLSQVSVNSLSKHSPLYFNKSASDGAGILSENILTCQCMSVRFDNLKIIIISDFSDDYLTVVYRLCEMSLMCVKKIVIWPSQDFTIHLPRLAYQN